MINPVFKIHPNMHDLNPWVFIANMNYLFIKKLAISESTTMTQDVLSL